MKDDPRRIAELAAYFTHCNLQVSASWPVLVVGSRQCLAFWLSPTSAVLQAPSPPSPVASLPNPITAARAPGPVPALRHERVLQAQELQHLRHLLPPTAGAAAG